MFHPLQGQIIKALGVSATVDPAKEIARRVTFMREYLDSTGARGFVLGISGGVDSTLAGRLSQLAVEQIRADGGEAEFYAVRLPYGRQADEDDAEAAMKWVAADHQLTLNIKAATDGLAEAYADELGEPLSDFNKGNVKARIRMVAQYAVAGDRGLLVVGSDQAAENLTGFFTKFGDGSADLHPLAGLTKGQVRALAKHLGAPAQLWEKVPTADLLDERPLRTDEDELGVSYADIDAYLEGREISSEAAAKLEDKWQRGRHKRRMPVTPADTWWR